MMNDVAFLFDQFRHNTQSGMDVQGVSRVPRCSLKGGTQMQSVRQLQKRIVDV